ncbi:nitroreductase family protein [Neisseria wadsworthii]|uniref:Nitroreductase n=1 Tax=Neisseria wadsworthii 9715 TaxID=1030841 RepID=G4CR63_9NEIS|nr:nitroreductase family protein [Neisseria wadsworthii]EGZ45476.1 nitroreductase [Neisseria wadsworthii 9715]QMT35277.1 nitroreductase family protein [Neisseria wadsworthii]
MNPTISLLKNHRTYRSFKTSETLPQEHLQAIIDCARQAPSWMNGQHYTIINITSPELRQRITEQLPANPQIGQCATYFIFLADLHKADLCRQAYEGTFAAAGTPDAFMTAVTDAVLAAQNAATAAESLGYAICYTGGIRLIAPQLAEMLKLPPHTFPVVGLCIGTPNVEMRVKPRLPQAAAYAENQYPSDQCLSENLAAYEQTMTEFGEAREKFPYREKFARFYSQPYGPDNIEFMQSIGWLNWYQTK